MSIFAANEKTIADILHKGMLDGVRKQLKTNLMNTLEKDVDTAIEQVVSGMKGYVESYWDSLKGTATFNVTINGVKKNASN